MATNSKNGLTGRAGLTGQAPRQRKRSELIAHQIAEFILNEGLEPGTTLPPEHEMVESFGVARTTVREALRLLETRGVLTIRPGPRGGPVVRLPRPSDLGEALTLILQFEKATLVDVIEARRWLEAAVARLAATRITPERLEELRRINREMEARAEAQEDSLELNREFHGCVAKASENPVFLTFVETIMALGDGHTVGVSYPKKNMLAIVAAHDRIIDALAAGDPEAAGTAMYEHLDESLQYWTRRYKSAVSQPVSWIL
jgi:GntR family transcriptional regulator, transcriptional repressor for pyruvate dehydrogenase complex